MRTATLLSVMFVLALPAAAQWEAVTQPRPPANFMTVFHSGQGNLFAGFSDGTRGYLVRSSDLGITWQRADSTLPFVNNLGTAPLSLTSIGSRIFTGTIDGVYRSTNLGATWTKGGTFGGYTEAYSLGTRDTTLFVGYYNIARSANYGTTWTPASFGLPASITMAVAATGNYVFAATDGVYRSTDGGVNFTSVNARIHSANTEDLVFSGTTLFAANSDSGVFRTTDYGATWQAVNNGIVGFARHARRLLAGAGMVFVWTDSGMYATNDNGASWVMAMQQEAYTSLMAISGDFVFARGAFGLVRHPLYDFFPAATATGVVTGPGSYPFNPTGVTLNLSSAPGYAVQVDVKRFAGAAVSPSFSGTPPATTSGYRWVISASLAGYSATGEIRINLSSFGAGISDPASIKIYKRSSSGTGTFVELPTIYSPGTNELVATITGFSEFILGGPGGALDVEGDLAVPGRFALEQNYPNPFNPSTTIRFQLPGESIVSLKVFNLLGEAVSELVNGEMAAGAHEVLFNASRLASGVYFVRIYARGTDPDAGTGEFRSVKKMLLAK